MTKGRIDKAFAGGALLPTIDKAQRATKWATKQAHHQADWQRKQARRGLSLVRAQEDDQREDWQDEQADYSNMGGTLIDFDRGWHPYDGGAA